MNAAIFFGLLLGQRKALCLQFHAHHMIRVALTDFLHERILFKTPYAKPVRYTFVAAGSLLESYIVTGAVGRDPDLDVTLSAAVAADFHIAFFILDSEVIEGANQKYPFDHFRFDSREVGHSQ